MAQAIGGPAGWLTIGSALACDSIVTAGPSRRPGDYVAANRAVWGDWSVPESGLRLLPEDLTGLDALELGCGTGYISAWLARLGARPVGLDFAAGQLRIARLLQR